MNFGIVGCGKMGQALMIGMKDVLEGAVVCCDVSETQLKNMRGFLGDYVDYTTDVHRVAQECDIVLLAVKPIHAPDVLKILATGKKKQILSIVAGLSHDSLTRLVQSETEVSIEVIRIMPNTPALVGQGAIVIYDHGFSDETRAFLMKLFSSVGFCHFVTNESMMDGVTGLSGSGPALCAMFVEALSDAGVAQGLTRELSSALAHETLLGTAKLLERQHPAILKENVMSPGGTTAAGVLAAENAGFRSATQAFVCAATKCSREMH